MAWQITTKGLHLRQMRYTGGIWLGAMCRAGTNGIALAGAEKQSRRAHHEEKGMYTSRVLVSVFIAVGMLVSTASALNMETVPVGNPGNANDTHGEGYGSVAYAYSIGKYEVTTRQYTA